MTDQVDERYFDSMRGTTDAAMLLLAGRRVARWMRIWRVRPRSRGCRIVVIGRAEACGEVEKGAAEGAAVVYIDAEVLVHELAAAAGAPAGQPAGPEVFDQVIERIAGEVHSADLVVLAATAVGPAELVAAGAVDGLGGSLAPEPGGLGAAMSRLAAAWEMPAEGAWVPKAIASPAVAGQLAATLRAALSAPVAVTAGASRNGGAR